MTLHDHIAAIDGALHQLDGMPKADIRDLAERLAVLSDLVAGVANGRDAAIERGAAALQTLKALPPSGALLQRAVCQNAVSVSMMRGA